jgi:holo-[acyl-carrier protein] synthase
MVTKPKILVGTDVVYIPDFSRSIKIGGKRMLEKIFTVAELKNQKPEHLAGIFAAKEAAMKALGIKLGKWQTIDIRYGQQGKPKVILSEKLKHNSCDISISHSHNYAIAVFVCIL